VGVDVVGGDSTVGGAGKGDPPIVGSGVDVAITVGTGVGMGTQLVGGPVKPGGQGMGVGGGGGGGPMQTPFAKV